MNTARYPWHCLRRAMQRAGPSGWGAGLGCARHDDSDACNCYATPSATAQSLEELDFMRSACSAAQRGQVELLQRLLARNPAAVRSDGAGDSSGYTPLHYAARAGHVACVQLLLKCVGASGRWNAKWGGPVMAE